MKIIFQYEHLDHSPALEEHATAKLEATKRILEAYDQDDAVTANIDFEKATSHHNHGDIHTIRIRMEVGGQTINVDETGDDVYQLVDIVMGKLHSAVQRFKEHDVARRHGED